MRTVILADCHGRPELVINALKDAGSWDRLVFAGDFLDIGPHQDRCLALLQEHGAEMLYGNHECFSEDTEVLTTDGWAPHDKITPDTTLLTYDVDKDLVHPQRPLAVVRRLHDGEMFAIEDRHTSLRITPGHRLLYASDNGSRNLKWRRDAISHLCDKKGLHMMVSGRTEHRGCALTDDEIRIGAWVLTDGTISRRHGYVTFYQRKSKAHLIHSILDRLGWRYTVKERTRGITHICGRRLLAQPEPEVALRLSVPFHRAATALVPTKDSLPAWTENLSDRQFDVFLHALIDGDGSRHKSAPETSLMLYPSTRALGDAVQTLCFLHGYRTSMHEYRPGQWRLNINKRRSKAYKGFHRRVERYHYRGTVWCVQTPDDTVIVRRNGKISITGNCSILYRRPIWPQHKASWEYVALFERMLLLGEWNVATECEGVLITHAGLSAGHAFLHPSWGAREWADDLNTRFAADTSRDWFWAADSPIWFRPKNEYPALDIVQVAGHTPPHMLPTYEGFHVIDPHARGMDKSRFRYAVIEDGVVSVHDSREARAAA